MSKIINKSDLYPIFSRENMFTQSNLSSSTSEIQIKFLSSLFLFPHKLFEMLFHWQTVLQDVLHVEKTLQYVNAYSYVFFFVLIKSKLVLFLLRSMSRLATKRLVVKVKIENVIVN